MGLAAMLILFGRPAGAGAEAPQLAFIPDRISDYPGPEADYWPAGSGVSGKKVIIRQGPVRKLRSGQVGPERLREEENRLELD
jgi:hypothetical protein